MRDTCSSRTVDLAAEDETTLLIWLLGFQQLIAFFAPVPAQAARARVPCDHLRDALIRARWPLAGAKRRAALKAWAIVIRELDSDARIRAVNVQVAGRRMKHFEYVARVRTATPK